MNQFSKIAAIILLFSSTLQAQDAFKEGQKIIGGGLNFSNSENTEPNPSFGFFGSNVTETNTDVFSIRPYYGRFFTDRSMIGIRLVFNANNIESIQRDAFIDFASTKNQTSELGGGLFLRRYFTANEKFGLFIDGSLNYLRSVNDFESSFVSSLEDRVVTERTVGTSESKQHKVSLEAQLGLYFLVLPQLSIETKLGTAAIEYTDSTIDRSEFVNGNIIQLTPEARESSATELDIDFANEIAFDQLFTINYFF